MGETPEQQIDALRAEIAALTEALEAERSRNATPGSSQTAGQTAEQMNERLQENLRDGIEELEKRIDAHPMPSVLISFGIGLLLGRLLLR